jgi:hypothetical protein
MTAADDNDYKSTNTEIILLVLPILLIPFI